LAKNMVEAGVRIIQLRIKDEPESTIIDIAKKVRRVIPKGTLFIVNDSPDIAIQSEADGVHLGQSDMSFNEAREILGPNMIIGLSTHNPNQTKVACELGPNYIGVGPVFKTPTKKIADPPLGIDKMEEMLSLSTVPAVVLGGIDHSNIQSVVDAGAKNICAVRCINQSANPLNDLKKIIDVVEN